MGVDQTRLPSLPASERHVFLDPYLEPIGPAAPYFRATHPGNAFEQRAYRVQLDAEERALNAVLERSGDVAARHPLKLPLHNDGLERKCRRQGKKPSPAVGNKAQGCRKQDAGSDAE